MGQAVDLADLPQSTPQGPVAGADDLLAQMAGAEIDRLLAEAEADVVPAANPQNDEAAVAAAFPTLKSEAAAPPPTKATADESLAGELDSLLNTLTSAREAPPQAPAPAAQVDVGVAATESAREPSPTVVAPPAAEEAVVMEQTSAAERSALSAPPDVEPAAAKAMDIAIAAAADAAVVDESGEPRVARLTWLLRPLEWLNAPIANCPDLLREFIGKAAILTVVNAVALIIYVRFIRRH